MPRRAIPKEPILAGVIDAACTNPAVGPSGAARPGLTPASPRWLLGSPRVIRAPARVSERKFEFSGCTRLAFSGQFRLGNLQFGPRSSQGFLRFGTGNSGMTELRLGVTQGSLRLRQPTFRPVSGLALLSKRRFRGCQPASWRCLRTGRANNVCYRNLAVPDETSALVIIAGPSCRCRTVCLRKRLAHRTGVGAG